MNSSVASPRWIGAVSFFCCLAPNMAQSRVSRLEFSNPAESSIDVLRDFDGDGVPDYFVGQLVGTNFEVRILRSSDAALLRRFAIPSAAGALPSSWRAASVGDLDGDGLSDLAVADVSTGTIRVFGVQSSAGPNSPIRTVFGQPGLGSSISELGDADGDGIDDLLLGASPTATSPGRAVVVSGATGSTLSQFDWGNPGDRLFEVFGLGDVDADGVPDFAVSATDELGVSSGVAVLSPTPSYNFQVFGRGVRYARGDDYDGDGFSEYLFSLDGAVLSASAGSLTSAGHVEIPGFSRLSSFVSIGDLDGDGVDEFAVGFNRVDRAAAFVDIMTGSGSRLVQRIVTDAQLVRNVLAAGDVDGDGRGDLLIVTEDTSAAIEVVRVSPGIASPIERIYGEACAAFTRSAPLMGFRGDARIGSTLRPFVRRVPGGAAATLLLGGQGLVPLDVLGLPGCVLYVRPFVAIQAPSSSAPEVDIALPIPPDPQLVGTSFHMQWAMPGNFSAGLQVQLSSPMQIIIGR